MSNLTYNAPSVVTGVEALAFVNTVTMGYGWSIILLVFFLILVFKSRNTLEDSLAPILYTMDLAGMGLAIAGLVKVEIIISMIVLTVVVGIYNHYRRAT
jgi:hypothetical protein